MVAFGEDALEDLQELQTKTRREWQVEDAPESITEITYNTREELLDNVQRALSSSVTCRKVLVVRGAVKCPQGSFEDVVRRFAGHAPMECQSTSLQSVSCELQI